ncbi:uncharacterized protein [Trachinotus anak]|uniref:uncharacterized protein isoform X2 n=1 Tax=Trachinotus anak TaxID=443729 RepID=UPI0039F22B88
MTGGNIELSVLQMEGCMSRGGAVRPDPFIRVPPSLCCHQDHAPMETHGFPPEDLGLWACKRPTSGRVTPLSRGGGVGRPILLSSLKGRLESRAKPASRTRTGSRPKVGGLTVGHHGDPVSETAETPTTPCDSERRAPHGQPGSAKTSELHLYLPSSSHCEDEDSETEEMRAPYRPSVEKTSDVKSNDTVFPNPSLTSREQTSTAPGTPVSPSDDITLEDSEHKSLNCQ